MRNQPLTPDEVSDLLRAGAKDLAVAPSTDLMPGVRASVPRARIRRTARLAVPLAAALALTVLLAGVLWPEDNASVVPVSPPTAPAPEPATAPPVAPPLGQRLHAVVLTPAEAAAVPSACSERLADPTAFDPTFGQQFRLAVADDHGVSVIIANEALGLTTACSLTFDPSGRPDVSEGRYSGSGIPLTSTSPDLRVDHSAAQRFEIDVTQPDDGVNVHAAYGWVSDRVARLVMITTAGEVVEVPVQEGGRFLGRTFQHDPLPPQAPPPPYLTSNLCRDVPGWAEFLEANRRYFHTVAPLVAAYDADGRLVGQARYVDPDSTYSGGLCP